MLMARDKGSNFVPAPAGMHQAVCVDVVDKGMVESAFYKKTSHKCLIVWEIDEVMDTGERFTVRRMYTVSLNEKASLRKDLESWRGKPFKEEELRGFDVETVLGANCNLSIVQQTRDGDTYANIMAVAPLMRTQQKIKASDRYVRVKDRPETKQGTGNGGAVQAESGRRDYSDPPPPPDEYYQADDPDIPF
jgi:hypothetical protein